MFLQTRHVDRNSSAWFESGSKRRRISWAPQYIFKEYLGVNSEKASGLAARHQHRSLSSISLGKVRHMSYLGQGCLEPSH